jgi:hypothetical protein
VWRLDRVGARAWRAAAIAALALTAALTVVALAGAATRITLVRIYATETQGTVFEVCKGKFDPPSTDPTNPAYCEGTLARWTEAQWKAHNTGHPVGAGGGSETAPASGGGANTEAGGAAGTGPKQGGSGVATGAGGAEGEAPPAPATPYGGSLDPTAVLGIENPLCGEPNELSAKQVRNCESSHSPEAAFPVGNYGWDIHIEPGGFISSLFAPAVSFVLQFLSVIWLVLLLMLKGCLIILGFAFTLSPFTDNRMLGEIGSGLTSFFNHLTSPWLSTLFVVLGGWGLYNGLIRRKTGETMAGMAMALVMMLGALWIISSPRDSVGRLAQAVNTTSLAAVSAPSSGQLGHPVRSYNDAMAAVWNQMTAVPFCAMDFSDVHWCMNAEPSEAAIQAARDGLDDGDAFAQQLLSVLPSAPKLATQALAHNLSSYFGRAPSIRELYLRFSPESGPRDKLWDYYNGEPEEQIGLPLEIGPQIGIGGGSEGHAPDKVSMQGRTGVLTRMVMVVVFTIGLLGGLLLLLWLAMKLVMATASAFVLVLATPLAMFFPVFGLTGRTIFTRWATSLIGAVVAKLIYSGLLGIVLLGSSVIGNAIGGSSPTLALVAVMAFWWAVFLSRDKYLAVFQIDPVGDRGTGLYRTLAGGYLGYRVAKAAKSAVGNFRSEHRERARERRDVDAKVRREGAEQGLDTQAHQRLDVATANATSRQATRAQQERSATALRRDPEVQRLREDPASLPAEARAGAAQKAARLEEVERHLQASRPQSQADRRHLAQVQANETAGLPPHGKAEIQGAREAIRREASLPPDAPEHRWRAQAAGKDPASAEGREAIAASLAATRSAMGEMSRGRLEQVDLHRRSHGDQRRPTSGLRRDRPPAPSGVAPEPRQSARPRRGGRVREWLSR